MIKKKNKIKSNRLWPPLPLCIIELLSTEQKKLNAHKSEWPLTFQQYTSSLAYNGSYKYSLSELFFHNIRNYYINLNYN